MSGRQFAAVLAASLLALGACKKQEDEPKGGAKDPAPAAKVAHGEKQGKGDGGGDKAATGAKDGTKGSAKPAVDPKLIERGAYLANNVMGCAMCHTPLQQGAFAPDMSKAYAGGLEMKEAFGTWRSPNITPDPETGLGTWTDEQIIAAVRDGKRPDGSGIHPIMPWTFYRELTDGDAAALAAFLRHGVKPISNKVERLPLPELALQLPPPRRQDPPDQVGHGAYLATLMHCAACHVPMTEKGPDMSKMYAGGMHMPVPPEFGTGDLYASNITPDPETGIGAWTEDQIIAAITKASRPDGAPIFGPMMFYAGVWGGMTADDLKAVAAFLKAMPPIKHEVPKSTFKPAGPPPGGAPPPGPKPT